eukprot:3090674-Alexandrium_andersonii.AAC.1
MATAAWEDEAADIGSEGRKERGNEEAPGRRMAADIGSDIGMSRMAADRHTDTQAHKHTGTHTHKHTDTRPHESD